MPTPDSIDLRVWVGGRTAPSASPVPHLDFARGRVATTLIDSCTITSDPQAHYDDTFDPATGTLTPKAGDAPAIYSGPCSVRTYVITRPILLDEGEASYLRPHYRVTLPWLGSEAVTEGNQVTINTSTDTRLVGKTLIVFHVIDGEWEVSRRCDCEDRLAGELLR